jgi:NAD(P)-dependent dehydrogenase (short-subunit alcohol dehydrogenase family)
MNSTISNVAIVTGAGRGIGRATAAQLANLSWRVTLVARSQGELDDAARAIGPNALPVAIDITAPGAGQQIVDATLTRFGRLDAVVNNAGLAPLKPFVDTTDSDLSAVLAVNLTAAFTLTRAAWPHLVAVKGAAVFVSSEATHDPFPGFSAYAAAKAGVEGLARALAKEGEPLGVRTHVVAPASVETSMFRALVTEEQWGRDKTLPPDAVADVIVQCLAGSLRHASGETIRVRR